MNLRISIDNLIEIVKAGGKVKTGIDIYNHENILLLQKDVLVDKVKTLEVIKENGIAGVPVSTEMDGGLWDSTGSQIELDSDGFPVMDKKKPAVTDVSNQKSAPVSESVFPDVATNEIEMRLLEIEAVKKEAAQKYNNAKQSIKKVLQEIKDTGGQFDFDEVEENVSGLVDFLVEANNPFSYLTQEMFSYDHYLYNHSINVCAIGTAVLHRFNSHFSGVVDDLIKGKTSGVVNPFEIEDEGNAGSFTYYYTDDLSDISLGFFLHDIGKIIVADEILNKEGRLTDSEFKEVQKHSYEHGVDLLDQNQLKNSVLRNIIKYHHGPLYKNEERSYPMDRPHTRIPLYARICKLADIYDAMTSKRCYKEAINPINVVTQIFRTYAKKDLLLQYILHAFVKSIGIYPPGSIIFLLNGQMAYVLESGGPIVIPFTDEQQNTLSHKPDPIDISRLELEDSRKVDNRRSVKTPVEVFSLLPQYIRGIAVHP